MKNFAIVGVAGYVAPRHLQAIHDTHNRLVAAVDPHDSVGVLDHHFPEAKYFTEIERFDRFLEKLRREASPYRIDYLSICSPNYLHDAHVRLGLRVKADVICEKPLVISPWNIDALYDLEQEFGRKVYTVLQLRLLPSIARLKLKLDSQKNRKPVDVELSYVTRRGPWYHTSWKGNQQKSGGIAMNIGIHFFDLLLWIFGECQRSELHLQKPYKMAGLLELEWATVKWFLSIDKEDLPSGWLKKGKPAYRSFKIDGQEIEFSSGFTSLHTTVYEHILSGKGYGLSDVRPSIALVHQIRNSELILHPEQKHPRLYG